MAILIEERRGTYQQAPVRPSINAAYGRRISWSGLWAGAFAAMSLQLLCGLLGVWAAPNAPTLLAGQFPISGIPTGVGIWYLIFTIGAFYVGGSIAARQTGPYTYSAVLQGFMTWAFTTALGFFALAIFAARNVVGFMGPMGDIVTTASSPGLALVSPGWMFGGLAVGLIAAVAGGSSVQRDIQGQ